MKSKSKSKKSYKYKYERKIKKTKKNKKAQIKKIKRLYGGFSDTIKLTKFLNYLKKNKNCCIIDKFELYDDKTSNNIIINACVKQVFECDKDVILIPFMTDAHANLIIIRQNRVEWFEPHGPVYSGNRSREENEKINTLSNNFLQQFVEKLNEYAIINMNSPDENKNITPRKYQLLTPDFLCPNFGPQGNDKLCMTWSLYLLVQIIRNPEEDTKQIIDGMINVDYNKRLKFITFIEKIYNEFVKTGNFDNLFKSMEDFNINNLSQQKLEVSTQQLPSIDNQQNKNANFMYQMYNKVNDPNYKPTTHAF